MDEYYELDNGTQVPIAEYCELDDGQILPVLDIPMMTDEEWDALFEKSRREHPEWYADEAKEVSA